jgi:hypothetical protein
VDYQREVQTTERLIAACKLVAVPQIPIKSSANRTLNAAVPAVACDRTSRLRGGSSSLLAKCAVELPLVIFTTSAYIAAQYN